MRKFILLNLIMGLFIINGATYASSQTDIKIITDGSITIETDYMHTMGEEDVPIIIGDE